MIAEENNQLNIICEGMQNLWLPQQCNCQLSIHQNLKSF